MRKDLGCLALILVSGILINYQLFIGMIPFDFDNLAFYHPLFSLAQLRPLVLWDQYQFSGFPVFAEPQYAMFYPLRWMFNFVSVIPGMPIFYILHYLLGIVFMYLFLRSLNLGRTAATGGTFGFIHGSYLQAKLIMSGTLFYSMVWIPLFFLFAFRAINNQSYRNAIYAGLVLGIIALIGSPHHMFYPILAILIYALFTIGVAKYQVPSIKYQKYLLPIYLIIIIILIGLGIGAIQLIPGQELFVRSIRANLTFDQVVETPLKTNWILASFLGGTQTPEFLDASAYFGVAGLLLILLAFIRPGNNKRYLWFWLTIAILAILIARGRYAPFFYIFYHLPGLRSLTFPCRSLILLAFAGSVLTAYGIEAVIKKSEVRSQKSEISEPEKGRNGVWATKPSPDHRVTGLLILLCYFMLIGSILILGYFFYRVGYANMISLLDTKWADPILYRWSNLAVFTALCAISFILYAKNIIRLRIFQIMILSIILLDLYCFSPRINKRFIYAKEYLATPQSAVLLQKQLSNQAPMRIIGFESSRLYSIDQNDDRFREYLAPKLAELYRLPDAQGYDPLMLQRYVDLMKQLAGRSETEDPQRMATIATCNPRFLNLLNVGYIAGEVNEVSIHRSQMVLVPGREMQIPVSIDTPCVELGLISLLDQHLETQQGAQLGTITVLGTKGEKEQLPIRAGIETADWRTETTPGAHQMPSTPAMTWIGFVVGQEYTLHNFYTRIRFSQPLVPKTIIFNHEQVPGVMVVQNVTLIKQNDETQFEQLAEFNDMRIYRNKTVYPRAFLVHQVDVIPDEKKLLATLADKSTELYQVAYLEEPLSEPLVPVRAEDIQPLPKLTKYQANRIELKTASPQNSFLVLSEIDYPGWQAWIDGKRTKIYSTDYILRGIYLPAGNHTVIFRFRPTSLYLGAGITILTLLGSLLGIIISKRPSRTTD
ncbi:MAG: YfhO family protein [bacterium]